MCTRATLAEVRQLQKLAGILKEGVDYSLDEMLDDEGMLDEMLSPPCGTITMLNGEVHQLTKWYVHSSSDGSSNGLYMCFDGRVNEPSKAMIRQYHLSTSEHGPQNLAGGPWDYAKEDVVPKPTGPVACPPGYTSYATGLDPKGVTCIRGNQALKSINGKPPKKISPAPRFGAQPLTK